MLIHELFEAQVQKTPDNSAVWYEGRSFTYGELNTRANQLAHYLKTLGVGPEKLVGVCLERSDDLVVAFLAVLKAGGACLPLEPSYPADRLAFMLKDSSVRVLLSYERFASKFGELRRPTAHDDGGDCLLIHDGPDVVFLDRSPQAIELQKTDNPSCQVTSDNLAFVFYTSGSTGEPKAVMWGHSKRDSLQSWQEKTYELTERDRHLLKSPVGFTLVSKEIFLPLMSGAQVVIVPTGLERDPAYLIDVMVRHGITMITLVASMLRIILEEPSFEKCASLRHVCVFGEPLSPWLQERFFSRSKAQLSVAYGATEAPSAAFRRCKREDLEQTLLLGSPLPQKEIHVLNDRLEPVPSGVCGEICIGGKLALGYLKRPDFTAEKFVPHPFSREPGARLYRTGDLGRSFPNGSIEFVGRADDQINIRGFRIEPVEIEKVICQHPSVREAILVAREDSSESKRLVAYVVPKGGSCPAIREMRGLLKQALPEYMIPSAFVFLDALPLSPNGKIDRNALPDPGNSRLDPGTPFVSPTAPLEKELGQIWADVLCLDQVGIRDNFFDLGGSSLLAVGLFAQIEKRFDKKLPLATLFQAPTIEQLAKLLRQDGWSPSWSSLVAIQPYGSKPPFFCVHAHGGNVLNFNDLARHLGPDQPFYGLQAQGLDGSAPKHTSIEEMASDYIKEIRAVQPQGPYFLGGYCFGGKVAFEMAQQLRAQGEEVSLLAMIDAIAPGYSTKLPWGQRRIAQIVFHWRTVEKLGTKEKLSYVMAKGMIAVKRVGDRTKATAAKACLTLGFTVPRQLQGSLKPKRSLKPYDAKVYLGKIDIFAPTESHSGYFRFESHMGWTGLAGGELDIHPVPGKVASIITKPSVKVLAEELNSCIEREIAAAV